MKKLNILFALMLFCPFGFAQRVTGYDNINNHTEQNLVSVAQTLDDGTVVIAAIQRPLLYRGKGKLMLIKTDIGGNPLHNKIIELPDLSICLSGGVFKTDTNQYTIFCVFDTTENYLYRTTHWGYIQTDTAFNVTNVVAMMPQYRTARTDIKEMRMKHWKNGLFYGTLALVDNGRLLTPITVRPYITNITADIYTKELFVNNDTIRKYYDPIQNRYYTQQSHFYSPTDFLLLYDTHYLCFENSGEGSYLSSVSLFDSVYRGFYGGEMLPMKPDSIFDLFPFYQYSNIKLFKDSLLLVAGTGPFLHPEYPESNRQSAIALVPVTQNRLNGGERIIREFKYPNYPSLSYFELFCPPYRFKLIDYITREQDSAMFNYSFMFCNYPAAYNQCLDFADTNRVYFGRTLCDVEPLNSKYGAQSVLMLTQFDSTLQKTWERYYFSDVKEGIVSVNATKDGGCLLVTRRFAGMLEDTNYTEPVYRYEIAVYKYDKDGNYLGMSVVPVSGKEKKIVIYPNPANTSININNTEVSKIIATDMQGKQHALMVLNNTADIHFLATGVYVLQCYDKENNLLGMQKLVKE